MKKFGLVGRNISYSFSQQYFTEKFKKLFLSDYSYSIFDIQDISEIKNIFKIENLKGFNITIPFKEKIIDYLDELSPEAEEIGAVNTVKIENTKKIGYNTDAFGFEKTLLIHKKEFHQKAIILGDGGAAKAVKYILKKHNIVYTTVSRKSKINFENISSDLVSESEIIIQCTPVGTFPNTQDCLDFPFNKLSEKHIVIDLIYNPNYTEFIKRSAKMGAKCTNGFYMLEQQAEKAWEIWRY